MRVNNYESTTNQTSYPKKVSLLVTTYELHEDGTIVFSGSNFVGHNGLERYAEIPAILQPFTKAADGKVIDIYCGALHTIFRTENGALYTCGTNQFGMLGVGHSDSIDYKPPQKILLPPYEQAIEIEDNNHSMYIRTHSGRLYTYGWNSRSPIAGFLWPRVSRLGLNTTKKKVTSPMLVPLPVNEFVVNMPMIHLTEFGSSFCHIQTRTGFYVYGDNEYGDLGLGHRDAALTPIKLVLPGNEEVASIYHTYDTHDTYVITKSQRIFVAGKNYDNVFRDINEFKNSMPKLPFSPMIGRDKDGNLLAYTVRDLNDNSIAVRPKYYLEQTPILLREGEIILHIKRDEKENVWKITGNKNIYIVKYNSHFQQAPVEYAITPISSSTSNGCFSVWTNNKTAATPVSDAHKVKTRSAM